MSKVFYTKFSEVSGERLDPNFYKNEFKILLNGIKKNNHSSLKKIIKFSSESWNQKSLFDEKFPYIEISEIDIISGKLKKINYINISEAPSRAKMIIRDNDILISMTRPDRGAISLINTDSILIASTGFSIIRHVSTKIKREFLFIILKSSIVLKQFSQRSSGGNYPAITQEEISKVIIPIPNIQIQNKIVQKMNDAYQQKQQKEQEAKEKLESIDDYLLDALGIKLPEKQDESVEDRVFFRKFSELSGDRIDPIFYNHKFYIYEKLLKEKPFRKFKHFINSINNGFDFRDYQPSGTPYLKVANIKKGSFDFSKIQYINFDSSEIDKNIKLKKGNLLLTRKGTFGNALALDNDYNYVISSEIFYIELKKELINTDFLEIYFNSYMGQLQFDNNKIGAIMGSLSQGAIRELIIPTPSPNLQETIVTHITNLKNEAKALKEEASQIYNEAKAEVEKMILGEEV
ncbi:MAG: restriction endonuclease subunit S [Sulfurovum sp.]|nr:restriction endonuclease subunit S [Sulfurovum sp.]